MLFYVITNERYSNEADDVVTFSQIVEMCNELGWDAILRLSETTNSKKDHVDCIRDERNEIVAVEQAAYDSGDFVS